ncbi:MAG: ankyrin repeat domain-containing protein [Methylocella sp.]
MNQRAMFQRIGVEEARALLASGGALVLDVRNADAFLRGCIADAHNVSAANLSAVIAGAPKSAPVLIYCYHGHASQEYAQIFSDFGFSSVYSLDGGYEAWSKHPGIETAVIDETLRRWLADNGFPAQDVNAVTDNGATPLMKASHKGEKDIVRNLLGAGARLDARNADGNNALWLACVGAHPDAMEALIEAGVDIDNQNDNGATPLMYAASTGKAAIVERLLLAGADTALETLDGFSALDMAATVECLTLLRRAARGRGEAVAARA